MKSNVYVQGCTTLDNMWNVTEATGTITHNMLNVFQQTMNSWNNRAQSCIDCNGEPFTIFCKPSETGQMAFCSQLMNYSTTTALPIFLSSCFVLSHVDKESLANMYLHDCICFPINVQPILHLSTCIIKIHCLYLEQD